MDSFKQTIDTVLAIARMNLAAVTKQSALPGNPTWLWRGDVSCLMNRHIPPGAAPHTVVMISLKKGYNMAAFWLNHRRMGRGSLFELKLEVGWNDVNRAAV